ncbi:FAS1-like dehydratase domain-containing protein [Herminiimonas arsenitoxidans]|uniref:FAS1-like dehydratase domain-containing protein n=1 Tax=Herminiimonas arsenitoxidans TaxID=1809410 RepID=UPI0009FB5E4E|nr:MaoC family dehydratase N-terminal domain-containing protein [Herminiimonas arsenitoxidans]
MIDYDKLMARPFPDVKRHYSAQDAIRYARGFGAGRTSGSYIDEPFLQQDQTRALPMIAVPLADGEFWQKDPDTGIDWQQIVHAEEALTVHKPIPAQGTVVISQHIDEIYDRGPDKGAVMQQKQFLHDGQGELLATIDVTTILKGNGGFGGKAYESTRLKMPEDCAPDAVIEIMTPKEEDAIFRLSADIKISSRTGKDKAMMRGVGCFGTAGRAVLKLVCDNKPERLKRLGVRYVGPMYTDEIMRVELWHVGKGRAVFRMSARGRDALVLNHSYVEFDE